MDTEQRMYNRRLVFFASCLGMLMFGIMITSVGAILPFIIEEFGIGKMSAGSLLMLLSFGILVGSIVFGPVVDRFGYKILLILCTGLILAGLEGIAMSKSLSMLRGMVFVIGFGGGVINGGTNALVSDISEKGKSANLSILGVFFGIGAFGVPLLLGVLSDCFSYEEIVAAVALTAFLPLLFFAVIGFPAPKQPQGFPIREGLGLVRQSSLLLMGVILFFESGIEMTAGGWTSTFFKEELSMKSDRAVLFLSLYWLGMILARGLMGSILKRISPAVVFRVCIGIAFTSSLVLILSKSIFLAGTGIFLLGVGFAAGFPVMLGYIGDIYAHLSGTAFSVAFSMALIGGMSLPYLTGVFGHFFDLRISFVMVPVSLVVILILFKKVIRNLSTV